MKIYQICVLIWLSCEATSKPNGFNSQQPYAKWAIAQSYSWVVEPSKLEPISNYRSNFDTPQAEEQAKLFQQQALQQAQQQAMLQAQQQAQLKAQQQALQQAQQQALQQAQLQALQQAQEQALQQTQQQALLQAQQAQLQALQKAQQQSLQEYSMQQIQRQAEQQVREQVQQHRPQSNSFRYYNKLNEYYNNGRAINNLQTEYVTSSPLRMNEVSYSPMLNYNQDFVDGIVEKVIQRTRGSSNLVLPTTKVDIGKIVREILLEYSLNTGDANRMHVNQNYENLPNNKRVFYGNSINGYDFPHYSDVYNPQNAKSPSTYPITPTEQVNPHAECTFNCGNPYGIPQNSYNSGEPIAIAIANTLYSPNRSMDPRILANSFTYTSV